MAAKLSRVTGVTGGRTVYANTRFASASGIAVLEDACQYAFHAQNELGSLRTNVTLRALPSRRVIRQAALQDVRAGIEKNLAVITMIDDWHRRPHGAAP